ncbi:Kynurenine 3-monooxygenase [Candidatus Izimaplasma bacterium HR1]|jgi:flavin-dependent dehydrogenase|uniref:FAD-binding protein n=1 Tax=Candidatus Izimoplasma sp. HR1 TaxID=1541959 RepID=UPI0004F6AC23|nr:Kynurenine 3-monooxygenase [Candidatus Izimaplasma bacterium HR1]
MYDIVIVGAGPAGSTLARLLPKVLKVLIIDKRNLNEYPPKKEKACGGLISPDAQRMLAKFDIGLEKGILVSPQLFAVKVIDNDNNLERFYQRNYVNIDREKFDRALTKYIPENVEQIYNVKFNNCTKESNGYRFEYFENNELKSIETKIIVGADGGNSILRKSLYPDDKIKKYISIQKWYLQDEPVNHYTAIFDKEISDYYSWTISKDNMLVLGTAISVNEENPHAKFDELEELIKSKGYDVSRETKTEGAFILRPTKLRDIKSGKDDIYLIGEAAGLISPSSAEGFSYAMKSAVYLSKALQTISPRKSYKRQLVKLKLNLLFKYIKLPAMYNKFFRKIILKTNLMTINVSKNKGE